MCAPRICCWQSSTANRMRARFRGSKSKRHPIPNLTVDLKDPTVALVTEGGLVPKGNPDRLESSRGSRYFKYSIEGRDDLKHGEFEAMHTGYDTSTVDQDPDRHRSARCHARSGKRPTDSKSSTITISSPPAPAPCRARWRNSAPASPRARRRRYRRRDFNRHLRHRHS